MTTYMLVDTSPEALPRGVYDSAKDVAAVLGVAVDSIYHPENKRGNDRLVWETRHGKGTAVWASEIEEFHIAVTKMRLKEE